MNRNIKDLDKGVNPRFFIGAQPGERYDDQGVETQDKNYILDILRVDVQDACQGILKNQGHDHEQQRSCHQRDQGGGDYLFRVVLTVEEPEKSRFHSIRQQHIENGEPGKYKRDFTIGARRQNICVERNQQKGKAYGAERWPDRK